MSTQLRLVEFNNHLGEKLRGVLSPSDSDQAVVFIHGLDRLSEESKFANFEKRLRGNLVCLRFDHSGCGISDGSFEDVTIAKLTQELGRAVGKLRQEQSQIDKLNLVAHSLGACPALNIALKQPALINKIILLSPALNQRQLLRYWFARLERNEESLAEESLAEINWPNYQQYFDEDQFQEFIADNQKVMKTYYFSNRYHKENQDQDYQDLLTQIDQEKVMIVHGTDDEAVPIESNHRLPKKIQLISVKDGDHHLEKPHMVEQYLKEAIAFVRKFD